MKPETTAIQAKIDEAAARGGGRVVVPPGVHRCGTLCLRSGVELHLAEGAVVEGGTRPDDYDDAIPADMVYRYGDAEASPTVTRKALVFAENAENVAITGKGTVRIGCPSDDTVQDAVFRDIVFHGHSAIVSRQPRVYLEDGDNGYLKTDGMLFENWKIECFGNPVEILVEPGIALRDFGHMTFRDMEVKAEMPFVIKGNAETPVRGIRFENVRGTVSASPAFDVENAPDAVLALSPRS